MLKMLQLQSIDVTCEMSSVIEALNMMETNINLYADYDFVDDESNKRLDKDSNCSLATRNTTLASNESIQQSATIRSQRKEDNLNKVA